MKHIKLFEEWLSEKKPHGVPKWNDSNSPDAEGRFSDLSIDDLADWLIKTRKGDLKKIVGSLNQQIIFKRNKHPAYAKKMEKTREKVYKKLDREDLLETKLVKSYGDFVTEKKSPYKEETLKKYKKEYNRGKKIPFGVKTSLIAQGMIPHEGGPDEGKKKKTELYD